MDPDLALTLSGICSHSWDTDLQLKLDQELDLHQMDAALLYLRWSLLPPKVYLLPSVLGPLVQASPKTAEDQEQQVLLSWRASRASCVLCPVWAGGHWTLLALQRTGS